MERRILLAVILSSIVLLGYNIFMTKVFHIQQPAPILINQEGSLAKKESVSVPEIKVESQVIVPISLEYNELENNALKLSFSNLGASLEEIYIKGANKKLYETQLLAIQEVANQPFKFISRQGDKLVYVYEDSRKKITKIYSISNNTIGLEIILENRSTSTEDFAFNLNYFTLDLQQANADFIKDKNFLETIVSLPDKILRKSILRISAKDATLSQEKFNWLGLKDRYFCTIFKPKGQAAGHYLQLTDNKILKLGIPITFHDLKSHSTAKFSVELYAGPLNSQLLNSADSSFNQIVNFGTFDAISKALLSTLAFIHRFLPNWGVCIIALSCLLFFIMYPLTIKSLKSMKAMQDLQPEMEKLRQQYKDQPQKFNKEVMELYKKNKVNPFGGCLPMLLQIPIFIALYQALLRSLELRGSNFLWIKDLSEPDRLFVLPSNIPFVGNELNILPILMAATMFLQQKMSSKSTVSTNPEQQKFMTIFFPIIFGIMFYRVASGLVLYWFVYSCLSVFFQWKQLATTHKD